MLILVGCGDVTTDTAAPVKTAKAKTVIDKTAPTGPVIGKWVSIFNGKDLDGWTTKIKGHKLGENPGDIFRVQDGLLTVSYDKFDKFDNRFGHLFYKENFSHYRMRLQYRFIGEQTTGGAGWAYRNSGIMIHGQEPESMGLDQDFPISIEVQLLGGSGKGDRSTCNLCTPGTNVVMEGKLVRNHCISSNSKTYHGDQWVTAEIEVNGSGIIKHLINGEVVMQYEQPQLDDKDTAAKKLIIDGRKLLDGGSISLQAESHPVQFKNIEIMLMAG
ncbi:MAG: DUF1080 domain-containing protein [Phycisphaerae bacterium]|nr:DUF1080 domain-containing protein [Phycisphaerae bacterium]